MKKLLCCIMIIVIGAGLFGCGQKNGLENMETVTYSHAQGGFSLTIPKAWEKKVEDKVSAGFVGTEPGVAFNVVYEIGGYDYYSLDKLAEEVVSFLGKQIADLEIVNASKGQDNSGVYQFTAQGVMPGEQEVVVKGIILEPDMGIRYYLIFTSGIKDFPSLDGLFNDIAGSFKINKSGKELYKQLTERDQEMIDEE